MKKLLGLFSIGLLVLSLGVMVVITGCGSSATSTQGTSTSGGSSTGPTDSELITTSLSTFESGVMNINSTSLNTVVHTSYSGKSFGLATSLTKTSLITWILNGFGALVTGPQGEPFPAKMKSRTLSATWSTPSVSGETATVTAEALVIAAGSAEAAVPEYFGPQYPTGTNFSYTFKFSDVTVQMAKESDIWKIKKITWPSVGIVQSVELPADENNPDPFFSYSLYVMGNGAMITDGTNTSLTVSDNNQTPLNISQTNPGFTFDGNQKLYRHGFPSSNRITGDFNIVMANLKGSDSSSFSFTHTHDFGQTK